MALLKGPLHGGGRRSARLVTVALVAFAAILFQAVVADGQEVQANTRSGTLGMRVSTGKFSRARFDAVEMWLGRPVSWTTLFADRDSPSEMVASVWGEMVNPVAPLPALAGRLDVVMTVPLAFGKGSGRDTAGREAIRAQLSETAEGAWDSYYQLVARHLATGGYGDAVVRLGHEMTGPFYPWSAQGNGDAYIRAFRHVHDVMRVVAPELRFEWNAARNTFAEHGPDAYPGDEYVDVIGLDTYYDPLKGDPVPLVEDVWTRRYAAVLQEHLAFAQAHDKPVSYAEWAVGGVDDPAYIHRMRGWFEALPTSGPGHLLYQSYWNVTSEKYDLALRTRNAKAYRASFGAAHPSGPQNIFAVEDGVSNPGDGQPPITWTSSPVTVTTTTSPAPVVTTPASTPASTVLLDSTITHAADRLVERPLDAPLQWSGPTSLRAPSFRLSANVTARPIEGPVNLQICFWQDNHRAQACALPVLLGDGTTEVDLGPTSGWWTSPEWRWSQPADAIRVLFKDPASGRLLNDRLCGSVCFRGGTLPAGPLLTARVQVVVAPASG